jgi:hypothetical protein
MPILLFLQSPRRQRVFSDRRHFPKMPAVPFWNSGKDALTETVDRRGFSGVPFWDKRGPRRKGMPALNFQAALVPFWDDVQRIRDIFLASPRSLF